MLVPIIVNGILLFIFQKIISSKFDRQAKKEEINLNVLATFRELIVAAIEAMNNMQIVVNQGGDGSEELDIYVKKIKELAKYYSTYKVILPAYENDIVKLVDSLNACIDIINHRNGEFTATEINLLKENLNGNNELLQKLCKRCYNLIL